MAVTTDSPGRHSAVGDDGQSLDMAGGHNKPTTGLPRWLVEAKATTRAAGLETERQRRPERQIHCWVRGAEGAWPGLVLDWRREGAGWAALAAWTTSSGEMVSGWVDAESVSPLQTAPPATR